MSGFVADQDSGDEPVRPACGVRASTTDTWAGVFAGTVRVTNTGTQPLRAWELEWSFVGGQRVAFGVGARVTQEGATATATGTLWNRTIAPGRSATFRLPRDRPRWREPDAGAVPARREGLHGQLTRPCTRTIIRAG